MKQGDFLKRFGFPIIAVLSVLTLFQTVSNQFIFDDERFFNIFFSKDTDDPLIYFTKNIFMGEMSYNVLYRPVFMVSLFFEKTLFGQGPLGFHVTNLVLHALASVLFFFVLVKILGYSYRSFIPALLFAVHPVHVDTVAFIVNRSEILALIFLFLSVLCIFGSSRMKALMGLSKGTVSGGNNRPDFAWCVLSGLCFLTAMLCKETAVSWSIFIALVVVYLWIKDSRLVFPKVLWFCIFCQLAAIGIYFLLRYWALSKIGIDRSISIFPGREWSSIIPTMSRVFSEYIYTLILPVAQKVDYTDYVLSKGFLEPAAFLSYFVHALIIASAVCRFKRNPAFSLCVLGFYIFLIPVSHIVPFFDIKADRFLYMPSVFFTLAISLPIKYFEKDSKYEKTVLEAYALLAVFYMFMAFSYSACFGKGKDLWAQMVDRSPLNPKFHYNLGLSLWKEGQNAQAVSSLLNAMRLGENNAGLYSAIGVSYTLLGDIKKAQEEFKKGLKLWPDDPVLNYNYAAFCYNNRNFNEAYKHAFKASKIDPFDEKTSYLLKRLGKRMKRR